MPGVGAAAVALAGPGAHKSFGYEHETQLYLSDDPDGRCWCGMHAQECDRATPFDY